MHTLPVPTSHSNELVDITSQVRAVVKDAQFSSGICHIHCAHTTAAVTVNENADPSVVDDIILSLNRIVQELPGFRHAEGNSTAHVKSSLVGNSLTVPIDEGELVLGTWQGIYFCEFDGPRRRRVWVTCTQ